MITFHKRRKDHARKIRAVIRSPRQKVTFQGPFMRKKDENYIFEKIKNNHIKFEVQKNEIVLFSCKLLTENLVMLMQ